MVSSLQKQKTNLSSHHKVSLEYQMYKLVEVWQPLKWDKLKEILPRIQDSKDTLAPLFLYLYEFTKKKYKTYPQRKDGTDAFWHPLNLVWNLQKAGTKDIITLCAALIHDIVEEDVDVYKRKNSIKEKGSGIKKLDKYEIKLFKDLETYLANFCQTKKIPLKNVKELIDVVKLLTRHKRDFYYRSISSIFIAKNKKAKTRAIQVKLADRTHNIQCLDCFHEQGKIYQCFKNLFILNNTKNHLLKLKKLYYISKLSLAGGTEFETNLTITEKLFKKCCKSTYKAFLKVCNTSLNKVANEVQAILQLAFRKYVYEKNGLKGVTKFEDQEVHPIRLFKGIVRKYDSLLHQENKKYEQKKMNEINYCRNFFAKFNFTDDQINSIITYKDAYALKEVISHLIYEESYVISGFGCNELCKRNMMCMTGSKV